VITADGLSRLGRVILAFGLVGGSLHAASAPKAPPFPADPGRWVGSPPTWEGLRGRVVLLDVWTFG
jgi:hypothetical protein